MKSKQLELRVDTIKATKFSEALILVAPEVDLPYYLPVHVVCPLPDHDDHDPSCYLQEDRWWCFGWQRGGDIIDFATHYFGVEFVQAVEMVEDALGIKPQEPDSDLAKIHKPCEKNVGVTSISVSSPDSANNPKPIISKRHRSHGCAGPKILFAPVET